MTARFADRALPVLAGLAAAALFAPGALAQEDLRVGVLLPGSVSDNGYNADGGRTAETLEAELGLEAQVTENVSVANQADLYRQYAATGFDVVIGWGGQFTDGAVQVSQEFPDVTFIVVNSNIQDAGPNLASIDTSIEDWQFLGGYVTAKLSDTGVIGWVGGQCFPATAANLHGVEQGARHADPDIEVLSTFTGDFEDPTVAQQAAQAMIDSGGAGALTGNLNNGWFGVLKAAQDNGGIPVVTEWTDNRELAPDVIASSIQKAQGAFVVEVVASVADGSFEPGHHQYGLTEDWGAVMTETDLMPEGLYEEVLAVQEQILSGEIDPQHITDCPS
ncbi:MAG: BMP family protein [Azospirillaceae bacterium]